MIRIGICDDFAEELHKRKQMIQNIMNELAINTEIVCFLSGEELLFEIEKKGSLDIIFMDVEMTGMNGIETAGKIRETDCHVILIFVSNYDQYCKEIIRVQPFSFIDKPVSETELKKVVEGAVKILDDKVEIFQFTYKKVVYKLSVKRIRYFESDKREIHIYYLDEKYTFYKKLDDVERELKDSDVKFIRISKSFLVNTSFVKEFRYDKVILDDGKEIGISAKYRDAAKRYNMSLIGITK